MQGFCVDLFLTLNFSRPIFKFFGEPLMNRLKLFLVLTALAIFVIACSQTTTTANKSNTATNTNSVAATPAPATPVDEVAMAANLYTTNCMTCHRDSGKGGKVTVDGKSLNPSDLTADKMKTKSDEKLYQYVSDGSPDDGMPSFKGKLTADQIKAVIKHVRKLQGS